MTRLEELVQLNITDQSVRYEVSDLVKRLYQKYIETEHVEFFEFEGAPIGSILREAVSEERLAAFVDHLELLVQSPYQWLCRA
ncbi:hypothetical protein OMCYN_01676 [cyanobiont of Ornithocercus magnificus]|nr:hypothetical protein OMCYN_01676 [cyanobiont of Ornithocercus magnificus]